MAQSCMAECKVLEYINCEHYDDANSLAFGQSYREEWTIATRWPDGQMGQLLIDINEFWRGFRARIDFLRGVIA